MDTRSIIASNIKKYRMQRGLKQKELADIIGTTGNTISNWEMNVSKIDIDSLAKICEALDVDVQQMYSGAINATPAPLTIPDDLKDVRLAFHRGEFEDLTQDEIDALATIAKTLKAQRKL